MSGNTRGRNTDYTTPDLPPRSERVSKGLRDSVGSLVERASTTRLEGVPQNIPYELYQGFIQCLRNYFTYSEMVFSQNEVIKQRFPALSMPEDVLHAAFDQFVDSLEPAGASKLYRDETSNMYKDEVNHTSTSGH